MPNYMLKRCKREIRIQMVKDAMREVIIPAMYTVSIFVTVVMLTW